MVEQIDTQANQNDSKSIVPETRSVKMMIWNIACILLFAAGIVFFIFFLEQYYRILILHYDWIIIASVIAAMVIIFLCFLRTLTKIAAVKFVALILAGIVLAANWYIYFRYIPKYGVMDGCATVKADPKYASATVEPCYDTRYSGNEEILRHGSVTYIIEDNPFYEWGYILNVISDGKVTAYIAFDTATGKYELFHEPKD